MTGFDKTINELLNQPKTQFSIPLFQRNYNWKYKHCKKLFDDIIEISKKENDLHFCGSIVYTKEYYDKDRKTELVIIDGQQRITTITLLYLALSRFYEQNNDQENADDIMETYIINKREKIDSEKLKLRQADDNDKVLRALIKDENFYEQSSNIIKNYNYIKSWINKDNSDSILIGLGKLICICIELEVGKDNPQVIFETMNSTGLELFESDKIRNFILMGLDKEIQDNFYRNYWDTIEKNARDIAENKVSDFVRDYLTLKTGKIEKKDEIYEKYKEYVYRNNVKDQENHLMELRNYSDFYGVLLNPDREIDAMIKKELKHIKRIKVNVSYPFLMQVYKDFKDKKISKETLLDVLKLIQSYCIRRLICGYPTNALNKIFAGLYDKINKEDYLHSLQKNLCSRKESGTFPNDNEVKNVLKTANIYKLHPHNKSYLFELLENYNTKESKADFNDLTIEHIFPQIPDNEWYEHITAENIETIKDKYLHTIGNLTLTGYNSELSNKYFIAKRDADPGGYKKSRLQLNEPLAKLDEWNENTIKNRITWMTTRFLNVWKHPNIIVENNDDVLAEPLDLSDMEHSKFTNKKIIEASMFGEPILVKNFTGLLKIVVNKLYDELPEIFINEEIKKILSIETNIPKDKTKSHYIELNETTFAKVGGCSAGETMKRVTTLCQFANLEDDDLQVVVMQKTEEDEIFFDEED